MLSFTQLHISAVSFTALYLTFPHYTLSYCCIGLIREHSREEGRRGRVGKRSFPNGIFIKLAVLQHVTFFCNRWKKLSNLVKLRVFILKIILVIEDEQEQAGPEVFYFLSLPNSIIHANVIFKVSI